MTLYELTKKYGEGQGEGMMWKTVRIISDAVEADMPKEPKHALMRKIFGVMSDHHYNSDLAHEDVSKMYYTDASGNRHDAPYWPEDAVQRIYEDHKDEIPDYNFWDFYVTMNMLASDNWCMLMRWFRGISQDELNERITEMSLSWLSDEDWPTTTKIWDYMSAR